jgi:hypothetical protein
MAKTQRRTKRSKTNKQKRNKTNKQKRSIRNRREAKKYIELLNHGYKTLTSSYHDLLDKEDYLLLPYLKTGFNRGWKVLKDKNIVKEIKCNSLCMTISILNSTLGGKNSIDELNPLQKLYLFFISYLFRDNKLTEKEVGLKYALRKLDDEISIWDNRKKEYIEKGDNRNIKKCDKVITRKEEQKKILIESEGKDKGNSSRLFSVDLCNNIDCEFLHEYQMSKNQKFSESYSKFCLHVTELFKGVVWLNMNLLFNKSINNPFRIEFSQDTLDLNINIRNAINKVDILIIPNKYMYDNDIFYSDKMYEKSLKRKVKKDDYWVYTKLNKTDKTIRKVAVKSLENKHYVTAQLYFDIQDDELPEEDIINEINRRFNNFVRGEGDLPVLSRIQKTIRNIGGNDKYDLNEIIYNTITVHWLYIHREALNKHIHDMIF